MWHLRNANFVAGQIVAVLVVIVMCTDPRKPFSITIPWHTSCLRGGGQWTPLLGAALCAGEAVCRWTALKGEWSASAAALLGTVATACAWVSDPRGHARLCTSFTITTSQSFDVKTYIVKWGASLFQLGVRQNSVWLRIHTRWGAKTLTGLIVWGWLKRYSRKDITFLLNWCAEMNIFDRATMVSVLFSAWNFELWKNRTRIYLKISFLLISTCIHFVNLQWVLDDEGCQLCNPGHFCFHHRCVAHSLFLVLTGVCNLWCSPFQADHYFWKTQR